VLEAGRWEVALYLETLFGVRIHRQCCRITSEIDSAGVTRMTRAITSHQTIRWYQSDPGDRYGVAALAAAAAALAAAAHAAAPLAAALEASRIRNYSNWMLPLEFNVFRCRILSARRCAASLS
jgi:hypothetical protein